MEKRKAVLKSARNGDRKTFETEATFKFDFYHRRFALGIVVLRDE